MKFMYEYCTRFFDTRHLVIAVNPDRIELDESLLFFRRLQENTVDRYDFANGAPAVGATLDLNHAPAIFERVYGRRSLRKNLFRYFVQTRLPNIDLPKRRYFTTNDPVMTPALLDHFFNQATRVFESLDDRKRMLLRSIYDLPEYAQLLPTVRAAAPSVARRRDFVAGLPGRIKGHSAARRRRRRHGGTGRARDLRSDRQGRAPEDHRVR